MFNSQDVVDTGVYCIRNGKRWLLRQLLRQVHINLLVVVDAVTGTHQRRALGPRQLPRECRARCEVIAIAVDESCGKAPV